LPAGLLETAGRGGSDVGGSPPTPADVRPATDPGERERLVRATCDHIAGMTDRFAERAYFDAFVPRSWGR